MPEKLVIKLHRYGRLVFGRVLEMPEEWRGKGDLCEEPFRIRSRECPALFCDSLWLPGSARECNDQEFYCRFDSTEASIKALDAIVEAVNGLNAKAVAAEPMPGIVSRVVGR